MRLLITTDTVGGVWTFTRELSRGFLSHSHEVYLVSVGRAPSKEQRLCMQELQGSYPDAFLYEACEAPLEWMQDNAHAYDPASVLLRIAENWTPSAYLFSQFCFGALPVSAPKIVIAHSDVLSWAAACGEVLDEQSTWLVTYRGLVQRGLSAARAVVAPTHAYLAQLRAHFPNLIQATEVIPNGRSIVTSAPSQVRSLRGVTAGRMWDKAKNLELLLSLTGSFPIVIAGEGDVTRADDTSELRWIGLQQEANLLQLYRTSAVYLCASLYEPFGQAALEAAQCGCAVVAMDIPSLREVWGDGALYFHDAVALELLLARLRDDKDLLHGTQQKSSLRAATLTASRMADSYLNLIVSFTGSEKVNKHAA